VRDVVSRHDCVPEEADGGGAIQMVDATISRVRMRDLTRPGRYRTD
jgi:hypothetical protein